MVQNDLKILVILRNMAPKRKQDYKFIYTNDASEALAKSKMIVQLEMLKKYGIKMLPKEGVTLDMPFNMDNFTYVLNTGAPKTEEELKSERDRYILTFKILKKIGIVAVPIQ